MQSGAVSIRFLARASSSKPATPTGRAVLVDSLADEILQAEPRPTRRSSKAALARKAGDARQAVRRTAGGEPPVRHLDRSLRTRACLPGHRRRRHTGRFGVRQLPQAPRRSAVALPRRRADLRLSADDLLLPGPRAREPRDRRLPRLLPAVSADSRGLHRGSAPGRSPRPRGTVGSGGRGLRGALS